MTTTPDDEDLPNFAAIMDYPKSMTAKALNASVRPTNATTHVHEAHSTVWVQMRNPKWLDDDHTVVNGALKIGDIWVDMDYAAYPGWEAWSGTAPFTRVFDGIDWRIMASSEESAPKLAYTHVQPVPANTWTVVHNLGYRPNVTVVDTADTVITPGVTYLDVNTVSLYFVGLTAGKAFCS